MSTKPGIPDHFSIHDVRDAAAGSPPAGGGTATRAQLHAMRDLSIPFDLDHPPTFDEAARLMREAYRFGDGVRFEPGRDILPKCNCGPGEICQTCAKDKSRQPVRDIREAMHPADVDRSQPFTEPAETFTTDDGAVTFTRKPTQGALLIGCGLDPEIVAAAERAAHPLQTLLGGPHVATLPDGSRVNLPAGTVLREGVEVPEGGALVVCGRLARQLASVSAAPDVEMGPAARRAVDGASKVLAALAPVVIFVAEGSR